jgi:hypothetical protein
VSVDFSALGNLLTKFNLSIDKLNSGRVIKTTGQYISDIDRDLKDFGIGIPTDSTGGLNIDEPVFPSADRENLLAVFHKHLHNAETNKAGGHFADVLMANPNLIQRYATSNLGDYITDVLNGGTVAQEITSTDSWTRLRTNTTVNGLVNAYVGGETIRFSRDLHIIQTVQVTLATSVLTRFGCNMEKVSEADDILPKVGLEGCSGDGNIWIVITATNAAGSRSELPAGAPTPSPLVDASARRHQLRFKSGARVYYSCDNGFAATKTDHIPNSGSNRRDRLIYFGIKTLVGSQSKDMRLWGGRIIGHAATDLTVDPLLV